MNDDCAASLKPEGNPPAAAASRPRSARETLHVLYILGPRSPAGWLPRTFEASEAAAIKVRETPLLPTALECLREEAFDVVLIDQDASERPPREIISALRSGTSDQQAIVVLAGGTSRDRAADFLEAGASCYLSLGTTTTRELIWHLYHVREIAQLQTAHQQLSSWRERHEEKEQAEILKLLDEQRTIFGFADQLRQSDPTHDRSDTCLQTQQQCGELLQAYVVMGRGHLAGEVRHLARQLHRDDISLPRLLQCYAAALTELVQHRGARSSRHVYDRGNLLLLDLLLQWADHFTPSAPTENSANEPLNHRSNL